MRAGAYAVGGVRNASLRPGLRSVARSRHGQSMVEFAVLYSAVMLPLTFMTIFVAQALWLWHGMTEFTRDGARSARLRLPDLNPIDLTVQPSAPAPFGGVS